MHEETKMNLEKWKSDLARGHTATWMATFITVWSLIIIALSWWLVAHDSRASKVVLAGLVVYMIV